MLQDSFAALSAPAAPSTTLSFEGISNSNNSATLGLLVVPPDPNGDVGGSQYVQAANLLVQVFDKNTGNPLLPHPPTTPAPILISSLFAGFGSPCETTDDGDAIVLYDGLADRWLISQFSTTGPPYHQCIAVSKGSDATGAYYLYDFAMPNSKFNDYPKFGVWADAYYMTDNQFASLSGSFQGGGVFAFDRSKMLAGDPSAAYLYFDLSLLDPSIGGMLPADLDGPAPPPGTPGYFAYFTSTVWGDPQTGLRLFDFHTDFAVPGNSTFQERPESPVLTAAFDPVLSCGTSGNDCIPQPAPANSSAKLDALSDRLMHRLQYRNFGTYESLVTNHTVDATGTNLAGVRYYQLRRTLPGGSFAVAEQATYAPDTNQRWMGSAAVDRQGNLAVGFSVSSASLFPSIRYAGRLATDPPGGLFQGEATLQAGSGSQTTNLSRWGDYTMLSVDPQDGCTFWYTNEYYAASSNRGWQTRIGKFKFAQCTPLPTWTATVTATATQTATPTPSSSPTPTAPPTVTRTITATASATPTQSATPSPTSTATTSPTGTGTATGTASTSPTNTPPPSNTPSPSQTPSNSPTSTSTLTASPTPTTTTTPTASPSPTSTQTPTNSPSPSQTPTMSPTLTATLTPSPTATATPFPSQTASPSPSFTTTNTSSPLPTDTPTLTPTASTTATPSSTSSPSQTETSTVTPPPSTTPTQTPSFTQTNTPTETPPANTVGGQVRYYSSALPVAGVSLAFHGPAPIAATTDTNGQYSQALASGATWEALPSKSGDHNNSITAIDATLVLQAAVGLTGLTHVQRFACDANADGNISAIDATYILQLRVGLIGQLPVVQKCGSDWLFQPTPGPASNSSVTPLQTSSGGCQMGAITYQPLSQDVTGQDFLAILVGDCNGSWQPAAGGGGSTAPSTVVPRMGRPHYRNDRMTVPVTVDSAEPLFALEMEVRYDTRLARALGVRQTVATRRAVMVVNTTQPGVVRLALASAQPFTDKDPILFLRFETRHPRATWRSVRFARNGE
ncbi:MAG: hypothetical protein HY270_02115 [Deltaproteobacteria bacterium]|nr:hypothetical protein [Deltaproteobacteria bacterium]